jgi:hypothetical protein
MIAISTLLLVIALSLLLTRVATVILTATGMSRESARFQARSALTGTGFTTKEAEDVLNHPVRRKVVSLLMLLGSAGIVAAASTTILGFRGGGVHDWWRVIELLAGLFVLVVVSRSRWVDQRVTAGITRLLRRFTDLQTRDVSDLLDLDGDYSISELAVDPGDWLAGRPLASLGLRDEGVVALCIRRAGGERLPAPTGSTIVQPGDLMIVYGPKEQLRRLDERRADATGDAEHDAAVAHQRIVEDGTEGGTEDGDPPAASASAPSGRSHPSR